MSVSEFGFRCGLRQKGCLKGQVNAFAFSVDQEKAALISVDIQ